MDITASSGLQLWFSDFMMKIGQSIMECLPKLSNAIGIHMFTQNTWTWNIMKLVIPEKLPVLTAIRVRESQRLLGS